MARIPGKCQLTGFLWDRISVGTGFLLKKKKIVDQVDFSDVTLVGEDGKEKSPPQLQILTLSQN